MNLLARNEDTGHFYLVGVSMGVDGMFVASAVYLLPDGTRRAEGGSFRFDTKERAVEKCARLLRSKRRMKGFKERCDLDRLPEPGRRFLKPDLDNYIPPDEMLKMVDEGARERYVEFECVTGLEDRFDEGLEYLALADDDEDGFYDVWDRYGVPCRCHESRFSRLEPTERALELEAVGV